MARETITTETGVALYPWLTKPDTKYSEEGEYKVNLILSKENAAPIIKTIVGVHEDSYKEQLKIQKKKSVTQASPPFTEELSDDGKPTSY